MPGWSGQAAVPLSETNATGVGLRPRNRLPAWCVLALAALLAVGCSRSSPPQACPFYETASGVSVNAGKFFAAHPNAHELCVTGRRCVVRQPGQAQVGTLVATGTATALTLEITVLAQDGTPLLGKSVRVTLHQVTGPCGRGSSLQGTVTVTGPGALVAGLPSSSVYPLGSAFASRPRVTENPAVQAIADDEAEVGSFMSAPAPDRTDRQQNQEHGQ